MSFTLSNKKLPIDRLFHNCVDHLFSKLLFLVGEFSFEGTRRDKNAAISKAQKSQNIFLEETTVLTLIGSLFTETTETTKLRRPSPAKTDLVQRVPLSFFKPFLRNLQNRTRLKGPSFDFFSALCDIFRKFLNVSKGFPLRVFSYFATECMLINSKGPFYIFRNYTTFSEKKFSKKCFLKMFFYPSWGKFFDCINGPFQILITLQQNVC